MNENFSPTVKPLENWKKDVFIVLVCLLLCQKLNLASKW